MYAVIETGGKQYRVELGSELHVELLDATPGSEVTFDRVLLVRTATSTEVGTPVVSGAKVTALVVGQERGVKTISFKYRPKARGGSACREERTKEDGGEEASCKEDGGEEASRR